MDTSNIIENIQKRICIFLEDKDWKNAISYCEKGLDADPENAKTYLYYFLATKKLSSVEELVHLKVNLMKEPLYQKALAFAKDEEKSELLNFHSDNVYIKSKETIEKSKSQKQILKAITDLEGLNEYKDSLGLISKAKEKVLQIKKRTKKSAIIVFSAFLSAIIIAIAIVGTLYFSIAKDKQVIKSQISAYNAEISNINLEKTNVEKELALVLKKTEPAKKNLSEKEKEKKTIEKKIDNLQQDINFSNNQIRGFEKSISDAIYDYGSNPYLNFATDAVIDIYYENIKEYEAKIKNYRQQIEQIKKELATKENEVNAAQAEYNAVLLENKAEIESKENGISTCENQIKDLKEKIGLAEKKIKELNKKFPYKQLNKIFK